MAPNPGNATAASLTDQARLLQVLGSPATARRPLPFPCGAGPCPGVDIRRIGMLGIVGRRPGVALGRIGCVYVDSRRHRQQAISVLYRCLGRTAMLRDPRPEADLDGTLAERFVGRLA